MKLKEGWGIIPGLKSFEMSFVVHDYAYNLTIDIKLTNGTQILTYIILADSSYYILNFKLLKRTSKTHVLISEEGHLGI